MQYIYLNSKEATMKLYFKQKTKLNYVLILLSISYCLIKTAEESFENTFQKQIQKYSLPKNEIQTIVNQIKELINNEKDEINSNNEKYQWFISKYTLACENNFFKKTIDDQIIKHKPSTGSPLYQVNFHFSKQSSLGEIFYTIANKKYKDQNKASRLANKLSVIFFKTLLIKK
jgi:hypothetical protein